MTAAAGPSCVVCGCTEDRACEGGCAWRPGFVAIGMPVCTRCSIRFRFPLPPNLANDRVAWYTRVREKDGWTRRALAGEPWLHGRRPRQPLARALLQPTMVLRQAMDPDNAIARVKWAVDLIVRRGWLVDDGPAHLVLGAVRQFVERAKEPHLVMVLSDLPAGAARRGRPSTTEGG